MRGGRKGESNGFESPAARESRDLILEEGKGSEDGGPSLEKTKLFCLSAVRK